MSTVKTHKHSFHQLTHELATAWRVNEKKAEGATK